MAESTALTILKKTPIHCAVKVSGPAGSKTITIASDLLYGPYEVTSTPKVDIMGIHWSIPTTTAAATIVRNSITVWTGFGQWGEVFNGFTDNQENASDIVVTLPAGGGWIILELLKVSGYNNTQHRNQEG